MRYTIKSRELDKKMICDKCGTENDNLRTICVNCGEPLSADFFSCPDCGKILKKGTDVCLRCGAKIYDLDEKAKKNKKVITTNKFVATAPLSLTINILLFLLSLSFLVAYYLLYYGQLLRTSFNIVGLIIAITVTLASLLIRAFINRNSKSMVLEKKISLLKSTTCVAFISNIYVFLFVILPSFITAHDNIFFFIYFIFYTVGLTFSAICLPIFLSKSKIRTR